jgi:c-di-GMP-binding flagellar brake protein YcgR
LSLVPIKTTDLYVGRPLPWPVYDDNRRLLLKAGYIIESQRQLEMLVEKGLFRSTRPTSARPADEKKGQNEKDEEPATAPIQFDDIRLQVGAAVQLQLPDSETRYYCKVVGFVKGKTILVTNPVVDDKLIFLREGMSVIVRVFNGKDAYGFSASVLKACTLPVAYLHLSFPRRIEGVVVRRSDRLDVKLIASVQPLRENAENATIPATILNLSSSGALVHGKNPLGAVDEILRLTFRIKINMIDGYIETDAILRSCKPVEPDGTYPPGWLHGVEFVQLQQQDILLLHSLAYQRLMEGATQGS